LESQHDGLTDWRVNWRFNVAPSGNGCRYTSFSTTTIITITLPRWHAPTNATDDIKAEWQRYITALGQHEAGHAQFALHAAADMHKQLKKTGEAPDCDTLRSRLTSMCQSTVTSYRQREREYDERTRHGATQGAVLRGRSRGGPDPPSQ
jgi:predicted secreted Zn-dependent protease